MRGGRGSGAGTGVGIGAARTEPAAGLAAAAAPPARRPLEVRVRRVTGVPVAAVRVLLPGGARLETVPGQAYVTGRMLAEGTRRRGWREIAQELEDRGMILAAGGTFEAVGIGLDALAGDWERALEWAAELVREPAFPEDRCAWVRRQTAAELESLGDQPEVRTAWAFLEQLYTPHPRARRVQGDAESLELLNAADCAALHAASLARGAVVAVAGEVDEAAVRRWAEELFAGVGGEGGEGDEEPPPPRGGPRRREVALRGAEQACLYAGHLTLPRAHPDLAALELAGVILGSGSGLTGRIPARIREKEGLAYAASAQTVAGAGLDPGRLVIYVGTSPATAEQAERGIAEELARLVEGGVAEEELEEARSYLLGREPFRRETARQWADLLAEAAFYDLPVDDPDWRRETLLAPDREAVDAALRRHLHHAELNVTVGLPSRREE